MWLWRIRIGKNIMTPRKITPHKGGRVESYLLKMTPETKKKLQWLAQKHESSMADVLTLLIHNQHERWEGMEK